MHHSSNGLGGGVVIVIVIVIATLVRRGRLSARGGQLTRGERVRPIAITLLDPVISVIVIGSIFWRLASTDATHVTAAILGGAAGVAVGWARARVMFVRAMPESNNIVLRRSVWEYALLALLIVVRLVESDLTRRTGFESLLLTVFVSLGLVEAIARSSFIVAKFLKAKRLGTGTIGEAH